MLTEEKEAHLLRCYSSSLIRDRQDGEYCLLSEDTFTRCITEVDKEGGCDFRSELEQGLETLDSLTRRGSALHAHLVLHGPDNKKRSAPGVDKGGGFKKKREETSHVVSPGQRPTSPSPPMTLTADTEALCRFIHIYFRDKETDKQMEGDYQARAHTFVRDYCHRRATLYSHGVNYILDTEAQVWLTEDHLFRGLALKSGFRAREGRFELIQPYGWPWPTKDITSLVSLNNYVQLLEEILTAQPQPTTDLPSNEDAHSSNDDAHSSDDDAHSWWDEEASLGQEVEECKARVGKALKGDFDTQALQGLVDRVNLYL